MEEKPCGLSCLVCCVRMSLRSGAQPHIKQHLEEKPDAAESTGDV